MERGTILIVKGDLMALNIIQKRLAHKEHVRVITASTGKAALKLLTQEKPDAIILDSVLPDMEGIALCQLLKSDETLKDIPVVFFTCFHLFGFEANCEKAGALCILDKGELPELFAVIHELEDKAHPQPL